MIPFLIIQMISVWLIRQQGFVVDDFVNHRYSVYGERVVFAHLMEEHPTPDLLTTSYPRVV